MKVGSNKIYNILVEICLIRLCLLDAQIVHDEDDLALQAALLQLYCGIRPCLVAKFKISNLSHQKRILHAWSIKSKRNKR